MSKFPTKQKDLIDNVTEDFPITCDWYTYHALCTTMSKQQRTFTLIKAF